MATQRLGQVSQHMSNSYPSGLLAGEVAIVTGSGQGIGKEAALLFAKEGAKVVVSDLDGKKAAEVADQINKSGGTAISVAGDVTADDFPKKLIGETVKAFGKINHIVNNAGYTWDKMIHTMSDETFDAIINCHAKAPFRIVREAAPYFRIKDASKRENRSIVNVSSVSGTHGNTGQINYSIGKMGIVGGTKTIAKEWGPFGVRANTVAYGYVQTRLTEDKELGNTIMVNGKPVALGVPGRGSAAGQSAHLSQIPLGRGASPNEAARAMLFLVSPLASYVTGECLEVTGGRYM